MNYQIMVGTRILLLTQLFGYLFQMPKRILCKIRKLSACRLFETRIKIEGTIAPLRGFIKNKTSVFFYELAIACILFFFMKRRFLSNFYLLFFQRIFSTRARSIHANIFQITYEFC